MQKGVLQNYFTYPLSGTLEQSEAFSDKNGRLFGLSWQL